MLLKTNARNEFYDNFTSENIDFRILDKIKSLFRLFGVGHLKRDDCFANISIPQLKQFFYDFIVPEMFTKTIYNKRVCQDTLDSIINKVVQVADQEKVQHELNQLTILSLPPPVTTSTVSGLKRKSSVAGPQLKKK